MLTITLILCTVLALLGGLVLRSSVARYEPVRSRSLGIFSVELRRRVLVRAHPDGVASHAFSQPCESRIRVLRVAGFPLWRQGRSVDLPLQVANMVGTLTARDFDAEFDDRFRLASFAVLAPAWTSHGGKGGPGRPAKRMGTDLLHK